MAKNSIGQFLAVLRKANGMTQQDVADRLNVSNKAVSRWERDECAPDLSAIPVLSEIFGVTCDELLKGERSRDSDTFEKKDVKVEKQIKNLINRTLSGFKTLIYISLAVTAIGFICMLGISFGFNYPITGFAVMLLFEVCAFTIAVLAVKKTKDVKTDNELFEMADREQISRFDTTVGLLSFAAFFAVLACILLSLPIVLIYIDWVYHAFPIYSYSIVFYTGILMALAIIYSKYKKKYISRITGVTPPSKASVKINRMTLIQVAFTILAGLILLIVPYFETGNPQPPYWDAILTLFGYALMLANVLTFLVFIIKHKKERSNNILTGIRNILLLPSAHIFSAMHFSGWTCVDEEHSFTRVDSWNIEWLFYAIAYCTIIILIFSLINIVLTSKQKKKETE